MVPATSTSTVTESLPRDLPSLYAITAPLLGAATGQALLGQQACQSWLRAFERLLESGIRLLQLRAKELPGSQLRDLAWRCDALAATRGVRLLLNGPPQVVEQLGMSGVHLTSQTLMALETRPLPGSFMVGASCHGLDELSRAERIGADFACLSPVRLTAGYAEESVLGLDEYARLVAQCRIPVFALGGMQQRDVAAVRRLGGQGVAGISAFWH